VPASADAANDRPGQPASGQQPAPATSTAYEPVRNPLRQCPDGSVLLLRGEWHPCRTMDDMAPDCVTHEGWAHSNGEAGALWHDRPHLAVRVRPAPDAASIAAAFHANYEQLAADFDYETRAESAVPWPDVPEQNRRLMIAVVEQLIAADMIR
jgi:hypothetical protein